VIPMANDGCREQVMSKMMVGLKEQCQRLRDGLVQAALDPARSAKSKENDLAEIRALDAGINLFQELYCPNETAADQGKDEGNPTVQPDTAFTESDFNELSSLRVAAAAEGDDNRTECDQMDQTAFDQKVWPDLEDAIKRVEKSDLPINITMLRERLCSNKADSWHLEPPDDYAQASGSGSSGTNTVTLSNPLSRPSEADIEEAAVRKASAEQGVIQKLENDFQ